MAEHVVIVMPWGDGREQARCVCGYRGTVTTTREVATAQAEQHRNYVAEIAQLASAIERTEQD